MPLPVGEEEIEQRKHQREESYLWAGLSCGPGVSEPMPRPRPRLSLAQNHPADFLQVLWKPPIFPVSQKFLGHGAIARVVPRKLGWGSQGRHPGKESMLPCGSYPGSVLCLLWVKSSLAIDFATVHSFLLELHKGLLYLYSLNLEDC